MILEHSKKIVIVPINTASNNVVIIWKRYYDERILKEIVLIGHGNGTYCKAYESFYELNDENTEYSKCLGFKVIKKIIKTLPTWILKTNKTSIGARFINVSKFEIENFH